MCHVVCVVTFLPVGLCRMLLCRISAVLAYYMSVVYVCRFCARLAVSLDKIGCALAKEK